MSLLFILAESERDLVFQLRLVRCLGPLFLHFTKHLLYPLSALLASIFCLSMSAGPSHRHLKFAVIFFLLLKT